MELRVPIQGNNWTGEYSVKEVEYDCWDYCESDFKDIHGHLHSLRKIKNKWSVSDSIESITQFTDPDGIEHNLRDLFCSICGIKLDLPPFKKTSSCNTKTEIKVYGEMICVIPVENGHHAQSDKLSDAEYPYRLGDVFEMEEYLARGDFKIFGKAEVIKQSVFFESSGISEGLLKYIASFESIGEVKTDKPLQDEDS